MYIVYIIYLLGESKNNNIHGALGLNKFAPCGCVLFTHHIICIYIYIYRFIVHILYARCHCPIRVLHVLRGGKDCRDLTDEPQQCDVYKIRSGHRDLPLTPSHQPIHCTRTHACTHITLQSHIHTNIYSRIPSVHPSLPPAAQ